MNIRFFWQVPLFAALTFVSLAAAEFDTLLENCAALWQKTPEEISDAYPTYFQWTDSQKEQLRFSVDAQKKLTLFGKPVQELVVRFQQGKPVNFMISMYNRGDSAPMKQTDFEELQKDLAKQLSPLVPEARWTRLTERLGEARVSALAWRQPGMCDLLLRWSSTDRKVPEYITIEIYSPGTLPRTLRAALQTKAVRDGLAEQLHNDPDGSRYMFLPMVDQGQKGYCVAASVERMLRYYGSAIDQHVIAQLAKTDADKGTSLNKAIAVLEEVDQRLGVRYRNYYRTEMFDSERDFQRFLRDYNSAAKRQKCPKIQLENYVVVEQKRKMLDITALLNSLELPVFRTVRLKEKNAFEQFKAQVQKSIDSGIPLCWATMILAGMDGSGGDFGMHVRIINGYNGKTGQLIYTDSWGLGHEKKSMPFEDAWAITVNLFGLVPKNRTAP